MAAIGFFVAIAGGVFYWTQPLGWICVGVAGILTLLGASTQPGIAIGSIFAILAAAGLNYFGLNFMTFGILL